MDNKKHAFVLSGSGMKLGFQVAVVKTLIEEFGIRPQYFVGNSGGGFASVGCCYAGHDAVIDRILRIKNFFELFRLSGRHGVISIDPMRQMVEEMVGDALDKPPAIPCTTALFSIPDGCTWYCHSNDTISSPDMGVESSPYRFRDIWHATGAIPGLMEPVEDKATGQDRWGDGGVRDNVPLREAVRQGADIIWIITPWSVSRRMPAFKPYWPYQVSYGIRALEGMFQECMVDDIATLLRRNDETGCRQIEVRLIEPLETLAGGLLEVKPELFRNDIEQGPPAARAWKTLKAIGDAAAAFPMVRGFQM